MSLHDLPKNRVTVSELLGSTDLPDPTVYVPFEKFAPLKESPDMLVRAAFWAFHAAWLMQDSTAPQPLAVEARHDGHQLRAITQHLAIRDAAIITRHDLELLQAPHAPYLVTYGALFWTMGISLLLGVLIGALLVRTLW